MDTTVIIMIVAGGIGLLAVGYFIFRPRAPKEVQYLHLECPGCKRRLRYLPRQIGHAGSCPRCNKPLIFPKDD